MPTKTQPCPRCNTQIDRNATRCPACTGEIRFCTKCQHRRAVEPRTNWIGFLRGGTKTSYYCDTCGGNTSRHRVR